jgi:hypothetical protein
MSFEPEETSKLNEWLGSFCGESVLESSREGRMNVESEEAGKGKAIEAAVVTSPCGDMAMSFPFLSGWSRSMFSSLPSSTQGGSFGDTIVFL